jgi:hypothetical protein
VVTFKLRGSWAVTERDRALVSWETYLLGSSHGNSKTGRGLAAALPGQGPVFPPAVRLRLCFAYLGLIIPEDPAGEGARVLGPRHSAQHHLQYCGKKKGKKLNRCKRKYYAATESKFFKKHQQIILSIVESTWRDKREEL